MAGVKRRRNETSAYPVNPSLCVIPTGTESQYESFQSIFANIMSSNIPPRIAPEQKADMSPYELLCFNKNIKLYTLQKPNYSKGNGIYFEPGGITHYIAFNNSIQNPYDKYQAKNTQGFCQMFAFFMYLGDTGSFQVVDQAKKIDIENFKLLSNNTYTCGLKSIKVLRENPDVYAKFKEDFNALVPDAEYGIKPGTTLEKYLSDFEKLSLKSAMYYMYDQPLVGYKPKSAKPDIWVDETLKLYDGQGGSRKTRRNIKKRSRTHRKTTY